MTTGNGRRRGGRGGGVDTNQQIGLADESVDEKTGKLMSDWQRLAQLGAGARATLKGIKEAKQQVLDALPGDDGAKHRFTYIDETGPEPVMYEVNTTPPGEAKNVEFERVPKRRATIDTREAPRGE